MGEPFEVYESFSESENEDSPGEIISDSDDEVFEMPASPDGDAYHNDLVEIINHEDLGGEFENDNEEDDDVVEIDDENEVDEDDFWDEEYVPDSEEEEQGNLMEGIDDVPDAVEEGMQLRRRRRRRENVVIDDSDTGSGRNDANSPPIVILEDNRPDSDLDDVQIVVQDGRDQNQNSGVPVAANPVENDEDTDYEEGDGDDQENGPPPQKMPRLDTSVRSDDDEGFICTICYENFTNSGTHRVCCLKCGHVFGLECIEKWISAQKRCPQCNCKAVKRDIRVLYVKNLKVVDTAELDRVKEEMGRVKIERNRIDLSNAQLRAQVDLKSREISRLQEEIKNLRNRQIKEPSEMIDSDVGRASTSRASQSTTTSQSVYHGLRMPKVQLVKHFDIREGQCRVGAYNEWMNLFVASHTIQSALYPGGSFGIKKINMLEMKAFQSFHIHQKPLRDMAFSPSQSDLLLTVGLDKKAVLFNCNSNCPVQTFNTTVPLWSCCWNSISQNIFYVGNVMGQIISYDIRAPQEPLCTLIIPTTDKSAVARLKFIPPAYQNQSFNMSGILIQKLNSVWFSEMLGGDASDPRYFQLPLEGPFVNADFEPSSRHVLVSSRPKLTPRMGSTHSVCTLGKVYSEAEERDVFSCDIVQSIIGGFQESTILCRSAIFSPEQGHVYVTANGEGNRTVRFWDIANAEQKTLVRINQDAALDFIPGKVNETTFLGVLTDKSVDVYNVK